MRHRLRIGPGFHPDRRHLLRAGLAFTPLGTLAPGVAMAETVPADRLFDVYRKGSRIGVFQVRFQPLADGFAVDATWDLAVRIALIAVFRYRQNGKDRWRGGQLVASDIVTDDNGETTRVRVQEAGAGLRVEGPRGSYAVERGTMTDLCFWNMAITRERQIIDSQRGDLVPVQVTPPVEDTVTIAGQTVPVLRYGFTGTPAPDGSARSGRIWYSADGRWVHAEIDTRGERLTLQLQT